MQFISFVHTAYAHRLHADNTPPDQIHAYDLVPVQERLNGLHIMHYDLHAVLQGKLQALQHLQQGGASATIAANGDGAPTKQLQPLPNLGLAQQQRSGMH